MMQRLMAVALCLLSSSLSAEIIVHDYQGTKLVLQQPAQRVIGMAPHVVENLYSAGGKHKVVGVMSHSNYPAAALQLPVVADYSRTNFELITELNPDLIVVWQSGSHIDTVQKLRSLGFKVYLDDPHQLEDVARSIRDMGQLMGTASVSEKAAQAYLKRLANMRDEYADRLPVRVLYPVWMEPLQTLNGKHIVSDVIRLCGGKNIFSDEKVLAPKVNIEAVIARNPEAIVTAGTEEKSLLSAWQRWPVIDAVKNKHIYAIEPDIISRHTLRLLQGAQAMCEHLKKVRLIKSPR